MRKNTLRTVLLALLFLCTLSACNSQTEPPATETENKEPSISANQQPEPVVEPEIKEDLPVSIEAEATATTADILVNGNKVGIGAYNINGSNYVSIRDLAYVLDGSRASFDVGWDAATKSIALTSGQAYTPNGSELAENSGGKVSAWSIVTPVLLNGEEKMLDGYTVGNVSYFSLKDMSEALDFSMSWFDALRYIVINTEKAYGEEPLTLEEEYKLIIDSRAVYAPAIEGLCEASPSLCYADYIDFDNDGSVELLLVSVEKCWEEMGEEPILAMIEVYGASDGHVAPYGKFENEFPAGCYGDISITEYNSNKFVSTSREWRRMSSDPLQSFYGVQNGALVLMEQIDSAFRATELNGGRTWFFYNMAGQEITEEQYRAIARQYVNCTTILEYGAFENRDTYGSRVSDSGILSVPLGPTVVVILNFNKRL